VLADTCIHREGWRRDPDEALRRAEAVAPYPLYVKPVSLGSSIGVSRASGADELRAAVEVALTYDQRCLVEPAQEDIVEINCAVLGDDTGARASLLEQPTKRGLLSYDDKYRSKGGTSGSAGMKSAQRLIPAPLEADLATRLRDAALASFDSRLVDDDVGTVALDRQERRPVALGKLPHDRSNALEGGDRVEDRAMSDSHLRFRQDWQEIVGNPTGPHFGADAVMVENRLDTVLLEDRDSPLVRERPGDCGLSRSRQSGDDNQAGFHYAAVSSMRTLVPSSRVFHCKPKASP